MSSAAVLERIWVKRARKGPMDPVESVEVIEGEGIAGDANRGGRRQVTVISREAWSRLEEDLGRSVDPALRRANFLVRGLDLENTRGRTLVIGGCRFRVDGETRPCNRMEEACTGLLEAMKPEWRGGVHGVVLSGGSVAVGDSVVLR